MATIPANNIYVGNRYVPVYKGAWDESTEYESLTMVTQDGATYISNAAVPVGTPVTNTTYWSLMYAKDGAVTDIQAQIDDINDKLKTVSGGVWHSAAEYGIVPGQDVTAAINSLTPGLDNIAFPAGEYVISSDVNINAVGIMLLPGFNITGGNVTCDCNTLLNYSGRQVSFTGAALISPLAMAVWNGITIQGSMQLIDYNGVTNVDIYGLASFTNSALTSPIYNIHNGAVEGTFSNSYTVNAFNCNINTISLINRAVDCTFNSAIAAQARYVENCTIPQLSTLGVQEAHNSTISIRGPASLPSIASGTIFRLLADTSFNLAVGNLRWTDCSVIGSTSYSLEITVGQANVSVINSLFALSPAMVRFGSSCKALALYSCSVMESTIPAGSVTVDTPRGTPLPSGGGSATVDGNVYSLGWCLSDSRTADEYLSEPGVNAIYGDGVNFQLTLFKNGQTFNDEDWELTAALGYNYSMNLSTGPSAGTNLSTLPNNYKGAIGAQRVDMTKSFYCKWKRKSDGAVITFTVPARGGTLSYNDSSYGLFPVFKNALGSDSTFTFGTSLEIFTGVGGGQEFYAHDNTGSVIQVTNMTITTGPNTSITPTITYNSSTRVHSISQWPSANYNGPYKASVTWKKNNKSYNTRGVSVWVQES